MPPRRPEPEQASASTSNDSARDDTHAVQSESAAGYNGASACTRSDAAALAFKSPIRSVPSEVLAEIFILAMHIDRVEVHLSCLLESSEGESRRRTLNPFVLCAVCSSWRSLAFSFPKLWRNVVVHIPLDMGEDRAKSKAADLVQWIKRSRSMPLTLYIFCDVSVPLDGTGPGAPIVSVFTDYATRWEAMYHQPSANHWELEAQDSVLFSLDGWHSLRRLCLVGLCYRLSGNEIIPWAQLTHLQIIAALTPLQATIISKECSKLVQISIAIAFHSPESTTGLIPLRNLVSLSLSSLCLSEIMDVLFLPSLRDVYISNISMYNIRSLLNLFTRSSCLLDKLDIHTLDFKPGGLLDILAHRSCDSLTSLKIQEFWPASPNLVNNKVLQRFTLGRDDSLCPNLRFLTADCSTKCSVSTLLKMVQSRICSSDGQAPLQYLYFRVESPEYKLDRLDKFGKKSGMQYDRQRHDRSDFRSYHDYSVSFQRQDLSRRQLQINHGSFSFDQD
ncbi:hypothetical protein F5887DRAFT_298735 [Amanita rubescens]|nr:hypothetical protein F5887DRAFT_298735 [Amanita rubescens]